MRYYEDGGIENIDVHGGIHDAAHVVCPSSSPLRSDGWPSTSDFICFASQGVDSGCVSDNDCGQCHDKDHSSESCRIHSIVTLLERVQNIPSYQPALEFIVHQVIVLEAAEFDAADSPRIVIKEKLSSFYRVRSKGLRAPPFLAA